MLNLSLWALTYDFSHILMKVIFAGTPNFAARALRALIESRHELVMVLTQPDRPAGRGMQARASAVKLLADEQNLPIRQPATLKSEAEQSHLAALNADVMVVVAYGLILPPAVLDIPRSGAINIHASLLPRWRGAAPIQRALLAGDHRTGISIMRMDAGLDTGPVFLTEETPIADTDSTQTLHDRLAEIGARAVLTVLDQLEKGLAVTTAQPEVGVTYAAKISKEEARIDWNQEARQIWRQIRAFNPSPGAVARHGQTDIKIWQARLEPNAGGKAGEVLRVDATGMLVACGKEALWLEQLQKSGGKKLATMNFLQGFPIAPGELLTS
jgi:methionyl-tRNA formyltransferase